MGAMNIGGSDHGSSRTPASSGEYPRQLWKNCDIRNSAPNSPAYMNRLTALALANVRSRNRPTGIMGLSERRSQARNAAANAAPAASEPITSALPQPTEFARIRPQVTPNAPAAASS